MGLSEVKAAIKEKTDAEVTSILDAAKQEAQTIIVDAQKQIGQKKVEHSAKTRELITALERKELAAANFVRKSILLDQKRKSIDAACDVVREQLTAMATAERQKLLADLAQDAQKHLSVQHLRCNTKDIQVLSKLFPSATLIASDSSGGFIAENTEHTMSLDYTYETLLAATLEQHLAELNKVLFP